MANLSAESLFLAGYTLAHAAWSVSDTAADELLCPLAVIADRDERRLVRFEADSQAQAIDAGKAAMPECQRAGSVFAFAREGQWRPKGAESASEDVLSVDFWAPGMDATQTLLQPFKRGSLSAVFTISAHPVLVLDGRIVPAHDAQSALDVVSEGVGSHSGVASLWTAWRNEAWHAP